jgi:hypothetical protein
VPVATGAPQPAVPVDEENVAMLASMGFDASQARRALELTHNHLESATELILSGADLGPVGAVSAPPTPAADGSSSGGVSPGPVVPAAATSTPAPTPVPAAGTAPAAHDGEAGMYDEDEELVYEGSSSGEDDDEEAMLARALAMSMEGIAAEADGRGESAAAPMEVDGAEQQPDGAAALAGALGELVAAATSPPQSPVAQPAVPSSSAAAFEVWQPEVNVPEVNALSDVVAEVGAPLPLFRLSCAVLALDKTQRQLLVAAACLRNVRPCVTATRFGPTLLVVLCWGDQRFGPLLVHCWSTFGALLFVLCWGNLFRFGSLLFGGPHSALLSECLAIVATVHLTLPVQRPHTVHKCERATEIGALTVQIWTSGSNWRTNGSNLD